MTQNQNPLETVRPTPSIDLINIINTLRTRNISNIPENKYKEIINEQDYDNYIFQIREELLSKVFEEINAKFLESQLVPFVVECAHESLKQIIRLNFFFHDPCNEFYRKHSSWTSDPEPEPCKPDSWSRGNISMKKREIQIHKPEKIDTVLSDYQLIKLEEYPEENYYKSKSDQKLRSTIHASSTHVSSMQQLYMEHDMGCTSINFNIPITSPAASIDSTEDLIINKIISDINVPSDQLSEQLFYKKLKRKDVSLPSLEIVDLKITPQKKLPSYPQDDEPVKKLSFPPLRLNVASTIRSSVELPAEIKTGIKHGSRSSTSKTVNFPKDEELPTSSTNVSAIITPLYKK